MDVFRTIEAVIITPEETVANKLAGIQPPVRLDGVLKPNEKASQVNRH